MRLRGQMMEQRNENNISSEKMKLLGLDMVVFISTIIMQRIPYYYWINKVLYNLKISKLSLDYGRTIYETKNFLKLHEDYLNNEYMNSSTFKTSFEDIILSYKEFLRLNDKQKNMILSFVVANLEYNDFCSMIAVYLYLFRIVVWINIIYSLLDIFGYINMSMEISCVIVFIDAVMLIIVCILLWCKKREYHKLNNTSVL